MKRIFSVFILSIVAVTSSQAQSILADWEGFYEGEMIIGNTSRPNDSVNVKFDLIQLETDSIWIYKMTYLSDRFGKVVKDYRLTRIGDSKVNFLLDEGDGIIIEMSLMNDCFYSMFEVMDNIYSTSLRKSGDCIHFDLFSSNMNDGTVTKNEAENLEEVFEVTSFKPSLHQTVLLTKVYNPIEAAFQKVDEIYREIVKAADKAYESQDFDSALELYTRASALNPSDSYVKDQLLKSKERISNN